VSLAGSHPSNAEALEKAFCKTFDVIAANGGEQVFRRWDKNSREFKGSFLSTAFEVFALGLGYHIAHGRKYKTDLLEISKKFWSQSEMQSGYATGRSTEARLVQFMPVGRKIMAK
jgi:hypothetical protein